jgi:F0F1-type ATP synthase membrane subunit b/b'
MDIQHLIDRLEDLIDEGRHMPFSKFTMIDEERALEIIDQMRISIPEEIEKSSRILTQRDRILAQANEEAARVIAQARERTEQIIDREALVQAAQSRAANIIEQARQEAEGITTDADQYVLDNLTTLEERLNKVLGEIRAGIQHVYDAGAAQGSQPPQQFVPPTAPVREQVDVGAPKSVADKR